MRLSCTFYDVASCFSKVVDFTYSVCIQSIFISREPKSKARNVKRKKTNTTLQPPLGGGVIPSNLKTIFGVRKLKTLMGYRVALFA